MTQKHLLITSSSSISWDNAITSALNETSKTIDNISNITIIKKYADIIDNKINNYIVDLDLTFIVNKNR